MHDMKKVSLITFALALCFLLPRSGMAQERITIQATAWGTSTQMGEQVPVKISIEQLSTAEDRKALVDAFQRSGHEGVLNALKHMKSKGRASIEGTVGYEIRFIDELPSNKGRRFRLITDRPLGFFELYGATRSLEYSIGVAELIITHDGKGSGILLPACKLRWNKSKQLEIETLRNPWEIRNMIITTQVSAVR